jgi:hypothetical protein
MVVLEKPVTGLAQLGLAALIVNRGLTIQYYWHGP